MRRNTTQTAVAPAPAPQPKKAVAATAKTVNTKIAKTNSPATPVPPPAARRRLAPKPESAQPSLFALDPTPAKSPAVATASVVRAKNAKTNSPTLKTPAPKPAAKIAKTKNTKTNPAPKVTVKKVAAKAAQPVRVANEPARPETFEGGTVWKMSGKHSVAYVRDAAIAGALLATEPRNLPKVAMAVYYDKKGKPFAWQVRFESDRWDEVMRRLA